MYRTLFAIYICFIYHCYAQKECKLELKPTVDNNECKYLDIPFKWVKPTASVVTVPSGGTVELNCGNGFLQQNLPERTHTFKCTNAKFNETYLYKDLLCRSDFHKQDIVQEVNPSFIKFGILKCDPPLKVFQVGVGNEKDEVKHIYTVCFDSSTMRPKYSFRPRTDVAPKYTYTGRENDIWGYDGFGQSTDERCVLSTAYVQNIQKNRVTKAFSNKYNQGKSYPYYFNRGHLVPYADFSTDSEKKTTCQYINAAPQWKDLNDGQWSLVEREVRDLLETNTADWMVYTGTYGSIPTTRGPLNLAPFFKNDGKFDKAFVPVPMVFWKIVHNQADNEKSRVYIGVNNPEFRTPDTIPAAYKNNICTPIPHPTYKNLIQGDESKGFVYMCKLDEFLNKLKIDEIVRA